MKTNVRSALSMMHNTHYGAKTSRKHEHHSRQSWSADSCSRRQWRHLPCTERKPCCHLDGRQLSSEYESGMRLKTARNLSPLFLVTFWPSSELSYSWGTTGSSLWNGHTPLQTRRLRWTGARRSLLAGREKARRTHAGDDLGFTARRELVILRPTGGSLLVLVNERQKNPLERLS